MRTGAGPFDTSVCHVLKMVWVSAPWTLWRIGVPLLSVVGRQRDRSRPCEGHVERARAVCAREDLDVINRHEHAGRRLRASAQRKKRRHCSYEHDDQGSPRGFHFSLVGAVSLLAPYVLLGGRPARRIPVAERRAALRLGAADHRAVEGSRVRRLRRHHRARLQHRADREEEAARAQMLEGPRPSPAYKGEADARQPELVGHRLSDARDAGAGVRRGRGVPLPARRASERQPVRARPASGR